MSTAMFEAVLGNLAVAAGLAGIAFLVGRRRHRPAVAHALWLLVLLKLLTPPIFAIPIPCLPAATAEPALTATKPMTPESVAEIPTEARSSTQAADSSALPMASA